MPTATSNLRTFNRQMAVVIRPKRVSDPLDDRVKARLFSRDGIMTAYASSSGSEHSADNDGSSPSLSNLVHAFFNDLDEPSNTLHDDGDDDDNEGDDDNEIISISQTIKTVKSLLDTSKHKNIHSAVLNAEEGSSASVGLPGNRRRAVMALLRASGYNAGICKTKWESSGGLTAGSYEYIDIITDNNNNQERYIVDIDFAAQFKIARGTGEYENLLRTLPAVVTVKAEELKQVVRAMSEAAKMSLKRREMSVAPWRKRRYMVAKWFVAYRRTVSSSTAEVECRREVGFECVMRGNVVRGMLIKRQGDVFV